MPLRKVLEPPSYKLDALLPCIQSADSHWTMLHQHRAWAACLFLQHRAVLHICLWLWVHSREWQQTLGQIMLKNLADAPSHLQQMLLCLQDYNHHVKYWSNREMLIVDALSCYAPLAAPEIPLNISMNHVHIIPQKKINFQDVVHSDLTLHALAEMILLGWPEDIHDVPIDLQPYHHACDVLTVEDGIILCGEALTIPPLERDKVLQSIHEGHQGISKCQYCACQWFYWPGINEDTKHAIEACTTCQHHHPQEPQQLIKPTPAPLMPMATPWALQWQQVPHHQWLLLKDALCL